MQIDPTRLSRLAPAGIQQVRTAPVEATETAPTQATSGATQTDRIMLSQQASEIQAAHEALAQTPEVRSEMVEKLKAQVQAGTYRVDPDRIAQSLLTD